ncbi:MAG: DUF4432 family protein [Spirochaetaceae bacterium]
MDAIYYLHREAFGKAEELVASAGVIEVRTFRFTTGVEALKVTTAVGEVVLLPFQGQQIWDAHFYGRRLTMESMFREPVPAVPFLRTYGGFLLHCGFTAMGGPTGEDTHDLHGELPNAPYQEARFCFGEDEAGLYFALTGRYRHTEAFSCNYVAEPEVRIYESTGRMKVTFRATNEKATEMEYMYLCHANFRPVDGGQLRYTAPCDRDHVRVRSNIPAHLSPDPRYIAFLEDLAEHPEKHNLLEPGMPYDPEAVLFIDMLSDEDGLAHGMQLHPDGSADFISYRPAELDHAVRWICRTTDQQGLGIVLPATAEPDGYTKEKEKGNVKRLAPGGRFETSFELGALEKDEAREYSRRISELLERER